jgi:hypothetical protein
MKIALTTLSNSLYFESRARLCYSAINRGVHEINAYDIEDIKNKPYYLANKEIFDSPRGMGYWLWKPLIISEELKDLSEGDILIYMDSGVEIISSLEPLINLCSTSTPILLFGNAADVNINWTKRDCFVLMDCDKEVFWYGPHCDASVTLFRKCDQAVAFVQEWLTHGSNPKIITDLPNQCGLPNLPGFRDHRHDQSIVSLLAQKNGIPLHRIPSQFGNHYKMYDFRVVGEFNCVNQLNQQQVSYYNALPYYNSFYGQLLNHHRTKSGAAALLPVLPPPTYLSRAKGLIKRIYSRLLR